MERQDITQFNAIERFVSDFTRCIDFIFSTPLVARDNHVIPCSAWQLDNFRKNPVFNWAHDTDIMPIGRVTKIGIEQNQLRGTVQFADAATSAFADEAFKLVKGGFLNATSVGFTPIKWNYSTDRNRPGGIDFVKVDLLEISLVSVPADVDAVAIRRAFQAAQKKMPESGERSPRVVEALRLLRRIHALEVQLAVDDEKRMQMSEDQKRRYSDYIHSLSREERHLLAARAHSSIN